MRDMTCLGGHTSNPSDGGILDSDTSSKQKKKICTRNHLLDLGKKFRWLPKRWTV